MDEQGVDHLFTLPLGDFVAARNELARRLKASGDKETAKRISKLPKPSISAWAINQLVRRHPELITALLASLDRQRKLMVGGLGAEIDKTALKDAKQAENETIGKIERALPPILEDGGHASGRPSIERCVKAIRAAAVHPVGRPLLENGHLTVDFDSVGFEALGEIELPEPKLQLVNNAYEEKQREKEERLKALQQQRIEAQQKIEEEKRRMEEERRRFEEEKRLAEEQRKLEDERRRLEEEKRREEQRRLAEERRRLDEAKQKQLEAERAKQGARLGEAAKILGSLRLERARLEEQASQLQDQVERARTALDRAERDAARAKEELAQKTAQITQLEQLLGLFDESEDDA